VESRRRDSASQGFVILRGARREQSRYGKEAGNGLLCGKLSFRGNTQWRFFESRKMQSTLRNFQVSHMPLDISGSRRMNPLPIMCH
jgi:hypothetical protein